jgi:hypothetical protein
MRAIAAIALVIAAAGCGSRSAPAAKPAKPATGTPPIASTTPPVTDDEPPDALRFDWTGIAIANDSDAVAVWRRLVPVAQDWELRVSTIPDEHVRAMATALLRAGNFACAPVKTTVGCTYVDHTFVDPPPTATLDDPCLRREIALWALDQLDPAGVAALVPTLTALARTPPPDDQLVDRVLEIVSEQPESTRLAILGAARAAGHSGDAVDMNVDGLSDAGMIAAARDHHIDGALTALDVSLAFPLYIAAIGDRKLRPETRRGAIVDLTAEIAYDRVPRELEKALVAATADPSCAVAAAAAEALAGFGRTAYLPRRPRGRKVADAMRMVCVLAAGDHQPSPRNLIATRGLTVVERNFDPDREFDTSVPDDDGDGDPRTQRIIDVFPRSEVTELPYAEELEAAMERCTGTTCTVPATGVKFHFGFAPGPGGALALSRIERQEPSGCE